MARTILLSTLTRRQGMSFQLKTAGHQVIGTMVLNPSTARHEMELSEEDFLKHSKELAQLCAIPGLGWYVVEFRETAGDSSIQATKIGTATGLAAAVVSDDLDGKPFFTLRKIAKDMGIDVTKIQGAAAMKNAIRAVQNTKCTIVFSGGGGSGATGAFVG